MSTPAKDGTDTPVEKKGLSKYVSRMKTVLKRSDGSKRLSFGGKPPAASSAAGPSSEPVIKPTEPVTAAETIPAPTPAPAPAETQAKAEVQTSAQAQGGPLPVKIMRSQVQAERAQKLGARFALTFDFHEVGGVDTEAYRIEKPIRMRIHRSCHKCKATFGGNKICAQCQHTRCTKCPRYPIQSGREKGKNISIAQDLSTIGGIVGAIEVDSYWNMKEQPQLTKPNPKPGGQPLVRKKLKQRVRRHCHSCNTLFAVGTQTCTNCGHVRCTDCPRDPSKKKKYPDGYPGDAFSTNTSRPIKYACDKCGKVFPAVPHPESEEGQSAPASVMNCTRCGHERCANCPRAKPEKIDPIADPEVLKSLHAKLANLQVSPIK